ncbi:hypothetical protein EGM_08931, partial [Macaca fascicularis]
LNLLKKLGENNSNNIFFSPMSMSSALAMVFMGAKGNTAAQMSQALSFSKIGGEDGDIHQGFQSLLTEINRTGTQYLLRTANRETYNMEDVLRSMGMVDAFEQNRADFTGMSSKKDLYLSKVTHKSFVEVNEEGTEAAAATACRIVRQGFRIIPTFRADHPFLFFIQHSKTNGILFCGRFSSP